MEVKHMTSISDKSFQDVSFNLRKGEILGFGGLVGAQRTEVLEGVFGIRALKSGEVYVKGKKVTIKHPADAMKAGIGLDHRGPSWKWYLRLSFHQRQRRCFYL